MVHSRAWVSFIVVLSTLGTVWGAGLVAADHAQAPAVAGRAAEPPRRPTPQAKRRQPRAPTPAVSRALAGVPEYTFQDGKVRGTAVTMKVPRRIVSEGGKTFMRITGSAGDKDAIPPDLRNRNRSTVTMTSHYSEMPRLSAANMRQTYSATFRTTTRSPYASLFEWYQAGARLGGYGTRDGQGPAARFVITKGRVWFETRYQNETKVDEYDLGVAPTAWHTYRLDAVWSHHPSQGRFDVYVDGALKKTITGRDVNLGPSSNRLPMVKVGLYGDFATGTLDVDDLSVGGLAGVTRPPPGPARLRPPGQLRVAS